MSKPLPAATPGGLLARYGAAVGFVTAGLAAAELLYRLTGTTRLSMVFLVAVLLSAYALGSGPAYLAACLAFLLYNFYLVEPRFSISMGSPEDLLTLAVFLIAAMLTGNLTGRVRDEALRATRRARLTAVLFEASRSFSASEDENAIRTELATRLSAATGGEAFVRNGGALFTTPASFTPAGNVLSAAIRLATDARTGGAYAASEGDWRLRVLRMDGSILGVAAWREQGSGAQEDHSLLEVMVDAAAAAISRARLSAEKAEAESRARTEDLRNALLSSISHDLRTPLAAIMASASSLHEFGEQFPSDVRRDLAATIQEEVARLESFVANLLNMTRLEGGALSVHRVAFSPAEVIGRSIDRRPQALGVVAFDGAPATPDAFGDPVLFEQAFANVLENAVRYGGDDGPVRVSVRVDDARVIVEVADQGPGVAADEYDRIFQKFYRSPKSAGKPGTGLGLSIARGLMEGMGGAVYARPNDGSGLRVRLELEAAT